MQQKARDKAPIGYQIKCHLAQLLPKRSLVRGRCIRTHVHDCVMRRLPVQITCVFLPNALSPEAFWGGWTLRWGLNATRGWWRAPTGQPATCGRDKRTGEEGRGCR